MENCGLIRLGWGNVASEVVRTVVVSPRLEQGSKACFAKKSVDKPAFGSDSAFLRQQRRLPQSTGGPDEERLQLDFHALILASPSSNSPLLTQPTVSHNLVAAFVLPLLPLHHSLLSQ